MNEIQIMLDIHVERQAYESHEICSIGYVRVSHNPADELKKSTVQAAYCKLLISAHHEPKVENV